MNDKEIATVATMMCGVRIEEESITRISRYKNKHYSDTKWWRVSDEHIMRILTPSQNLAFVGSSELQTILTTETVAFRTLPDGTAIWIRDLFDANGKSRAHS